MKKRKPKTLHDYLMTRMTELQGQHAEMARETGIAQATVSRIFHGAMPRLDTAEKLLGWISTRDAREARKSARKRAAAAAVAARGRTGGVDASAT